MTSKNISLRTKRGKACTIGADLLPFYWTFSSWRIPV